MFWYQAGDPLKELLPPVLTADTQPPVQNITNEIITTKRTK